MKKSIFGLNYDGLRKVEESLKKTVYGRQYFVVSHIISLIVFLILFLCLLIGIIDDKFFVNNIIFFMSFALASCFVIIVGKLKWFELVKKYYEVEYKSQEK